MATKPSQGHTLNSFTMLFVFLSMIITSNSAPSSSNDVATLLRFKDSLKDDSNALSTWSPSSAPCFGNKNNWVGLICSRGGNIWGLKLENMGLSGTINVDALPELRRLRSISFMNNNFNGPMPDFRKLKTLKAIFLSNNNFEGLIHPNAFEGIRRLKKVHLAHNKFSGEIPTSLIALQKLVELRLEGNQFQGGIPNLASNMIQSFNVSNNQLQGPIPDSVAKFDSTAFEGNKELCGPPMKACPSASASMETTSPSAPPPPPPPPPTSDKPIPIIAIVAGVVVAMVLAVLIILMVLRNRCEKTEERRGPVAAASQPKKAAVATKKKENIDNEGSHRSTTSNGSKHNKGGNGENGKLTFIREDRERFDLPDLLKAAAEILGSGCFGSSYKATLNNGNAVVVKRFKQMNNVGREEFQEHMRRLGRLSHPNLLPLVAYYYRKEEKLFITDPIQKGSLALILHGQTRGKLTLDWATRLKVIKGVAKGLLYLYTELPCLVAPHGHLKSSNVLLSASNEPILSDYGLIPLINQESAQNLMVAYKSPEYFNNGRITKKTDVWALGILIIEILTGKFPSPYLQQGNEVDMASWVESVIGGGFDKNMGQSKNNNSDGEMQKLLNIGVACCEIDVEKRLDIKEACDKIAEVKEKDHDEDFYSTYASTEADMRSSRGMSDDFTVIIN